MYGAVMTIIRNELSPKQQTEGINTRTGAIHWAMHVSVRECLD